MYSLSVPGFLFSGFLSRFLSLIFLPQVFRFLNKHEEAMLAVAKHQRYVSNYSGLLLPIYYNWEVGMGESNTSSLHLWFTCI